MPHFDFQAMFGEESVDGYSESVRKAASALASTLVGRNDFIGGRSVEGRRSVRIGEGSAANSGSGSVDPSLLQQSRTLCAAGYGLSVRTVDPAFLPARGRPGLGEAPAKSGSDRVDAGTAGGHGLNQRTVDPLLHTRARLGPGEVPVTMTTQALLASRPEIHAVHERLGAGNFGEVFRCTMVEQMREVAVKVLHRGSSVSQKREVELLGQLQHANLVRCYCVMRGPPDALVLELCSGGPLDELVHGPAVRESGFELLGLSQRVRAMVDILSAVEYLHSQRVVHRDIKSGNAFLSTRVSLPTGALPSVKVGDLGLARELDSKMTQCTGTWRYMAPEVLMSSEYTGSADIFCVGILLHETMTSKVPFGDLSSLRAAAAIASGHRPDLEDVAGWGIISDVLGAVMQACWAEEPTERPSAAYLVQCLQQWAQTD